MQSNRRKPFIILVILLAIVGGMVAFSLGEPPLVQNVVEQPLDAGVFQQAGE